MRTSRSRLPLIVSPVEVSVGNVAKDRRQVHTVSVRAPSSLSQPPIPVAELRAGRREDAPAIRRLYQTVAATPGGIARTPDEVTSAYVEEFVSHSLQRGILLVAELPGLDGLAAELHAYRSELYVFDHVLGDLTVAVHP